MVPLAPQLKLFVTLTEKISLETDLRAAVEHILTAAIACLRGERSTLFVVDRQLGTISVMASCGADSKVQTHPRLRGLSLLLNAESIAGAVALVRERAHCQWFDACAVAPRQLAVWRPQRMCCRCVNTYA
jgi:GAF domain-containing protein